MSHAVSYFCPESLQHPRMSANIQPIIFFFGCAKARSICPSHLKRGFQLQAFNSRLDLAAVHGPLCKAQLEQVQKLGNEFWLCASHDLQQAGPAASCA